MAVLDPAGCVFAVARQQTYHPRLPAGLFVSEATISRISKNTKLPPFFLLKKMLKWSNFLDKQMISVFIVFIWNTNNRLIERQGKGNQYNTYKNRLHMALSS